MLIRHSGIYILARLLPGLLGMITTAILTRALTPERYGLYGLALVVMSFGATMGFEWLNISFMRFYQARREDPRIIGTVIQIFAVIVAISAMVFQIIWWSGLFPVTEPAIYGVSLLLMWAYAWFELVSKFEIADFRPLKYLTMNLQRAVCMLAGTAGAAMLTHDPVYTAAGTAAGIIVGSIPTRLRGISLGRRGFDVPLAREIIAFGVPLAASMVMSSLVMSGTRGMILWLGSAEALGYYTAGFLLVQNTLVVLAGGIAAASYSLAVRAVEDGDPVATRQQLLDNATILLLVTAPASLGMALTAHGIAVTLVGSKYSDTVAVLTPWLAAGAFFGTFRAHFLDHAFQLGRRPYLQVRVIGVAAAISIGLSYLLIPRIGAEGAAIAVAIAMAVSCIHAQLEGIYAFPMPFPIQNATKIAISCAAMAIVVRLISGETTTQFLLQVTAGSIVYALFICAFNILGTRDYVVQSVLTRKKRKTTVNGKSSGFQETSPPDAP